MINGKDIGKERLSIREGRERERAKDRDCEREREIVCQRERE